TKKPSECTGVFRKTMGIPCSHELENLQTLGKHHFHPHWWLDNEVYESDYSTYFAAYPGKELHINLAINIDESSATEDEEDEALLRQINTLHSDQKCSIKRHINNPENID